MFKILFILLCIVFFIGCEQGSLNTVKETKNVVMESKTKDKSLIINSFSHVPKIDTICSCSFSLTKNAYKVGLYIFTTKFDTLSESYMKINNDWTKFNLDYFHQTSDSLLIASKNDSILINLKAQRDSTNLDNYRYKGNFELQRQHDATIIFSSNIYGECDF